jgi:hypothetical protein
MMYKLAALGLLLASSACANRQHLPNPPRGIAALEPGKTLDDRKEQFDRHAFSAAQKTTTVVSSSKSGTSVSSYQDLSLLAQDGSYYALADYLPELQKVGIAKEVENPTSHYAAVNKPRIYYKGAWGAFLGGPILGWMLTPDCGDSPSILDDGYIEKRREYSDCSGSSPILYALYGGAVVGGVLAYMGLSRQMKAAAPIHKAKKQATKDRSSWARAWNKAPSVTKSP